MRNKSTKCTWTTNGKEIKENDILGYGYNYPCLVVYNPFEAKYEALEFGYKSEGYLYRTHELRSYTAPWKILGNLLKEGKVKLLQDYPEHFDYTKEIKKYYK